MRSGMKRIARALLAGGAASIIVIVALWAYAGSYGLHVLVRHGGGYWLPVSTSSTLLSPSMRVALAAAPAAVPGAFEWRMIDQGFDVADLPVLADGKDVDHILLARIDPARFRFLVRTAPAGDKDLDQWMAQLGAALVVNGSYYSRHGEPDTPLLSERTLLGPKDYDAKAGAFVASAAFTGIRDLAREDWRTAFQGADNAMVSYPLIVANGVSRVARASRWLANRSFIGQDGSGRIIIGTTTDAFFSLDRLARFLLDAPLGLTIALNLDGGPVACQGISLNSYQRKTYGRWETQVEGDHAQLLTWPYGTIDMPIVLAVLPK
jgi:Phosphodiester glycosidase